MEVYRAYALAKLLLRGVIDSADTFPPLKSAAVGLCFVLEVCEVRTSSHIYYLHYSSGPSEGK